MKTSISNQSAIKPNEALQKKKQQKTNKSFLIWGLIGIGIIVNLIIVYSRNSQLHTIKNLGNGKFIADYQNSVKNHNQASQEIANELKQHPNKILNLELQLSLNQFSTEQMTYLSLSIIELDLVEENKISLSILMILEILVS